jgi:hypothetical protein
MLTELADWWLGFDKYLLTPRIKIIECVVFDTE